MEGMDLNQLQAFRDTIHLAEDRGMPARPGSDQGLEHLQLMLVTAETEEFSPAKLGRWLGWAQCAVVASGIGVTLADVKALNASHSDDVDVLPEADESETPVVDGRADELTYREFQTVVKIELTGNASRAHEDFVRRPENVGRWMRVLQAVRESIQRQNTAANAYISAHPGKGAQGAGSMAREYRRAKRRYDTDRARREWVQKAIAERIAEANDIVVSQQLEAEPLDRLLAKLLYCEKAIAAGDYSQTAQRLKRLIDQVGTLSEVDTSPSKP